jgi:hypothetical protein
MSHAIRFKREGLDLGRDLFKVDIANQSKSLSDNLFKLQESYLIVLNPTPRVVAATLSSIRTIQQLPSAVMQNVTCHSQ